MQIGVDFIACVDGSWNCGSGGSCTFLGIFSPQAWQVLDAIGFGTSTTTWKASSRFTRIYSDAVVSGRTSGDW
jgi:hypothetical protein